MSRVTLAQIANRLSLSRSTVSYALRNDSRIAPETRQRVQQLAEELGWHPDPALSQAMHMVRSTLQRRDLPNLAVVMNKEPSELQRERCMRHHLKGIRDHAAKLGFAVDLVNLATRPMTPQNLRRMLISRGVKGVIYVVNHLLSRDSIYLGDEFAYVSAGMRHPDLPIHYSINNLMSSGYQSIVELLRMGFKRPGVVVPEGIDDSLCHSFYGGVQSGLILCPEENRLPVLLVPGADLWIEDSNFPAVVRWLEQHRPDCILTTDSVQIQKLLASDRVTARPPVFSLDYYPDLPVEGGMDGLQEEVGAAAVDLLALQITTGQKGIPAVQHALIVEGRWVLKDKAQTAASKVAQPA